MLDRDSHDINRDEEPKRTSYKTAHLLRKYCLCRCSTLSQSASDLAHDQTEYLATSREPPLAPDQVNPPVTIVVTSADSNNNFKPIISQGSMEASITTAEDESRMELSTNSDSGQPMAKDNDSKVVEQQQQQTVLQDSQAPNATTSVEGVSGPGEPHVIMHKLTLTDAPELQVSAAEQEESLIGFNLNRDRKFRRIELNKVTWEIPERYSNLQAVGAGSYGQVCAAYDKVRDMQVAIKKLTRPFQTAIHAKRTYRELTLLAHMKHENVIGLLDVFAPCRSFLEFNDVYLVTHLMGSDLGGIIRTQQLSDDHVQFLVYQMLRGLKYIHSAGIVHRDLKPSNIAVNEDCELKVLDFGLARHTEAEMTGYVATRWYRAPEIMLNWMRYNQTVDIWSVGCILAELITSRTLFPGRDHIDQLLRIMTMCGTPDLDLLDKITSDEARNYVLNLPKMTRKNFGTVFAGANPLAIDLLDKMLTMDSNLRPTAEQALLHPYLAHYSDPNDEPEASGLYDQSFEDKELTVSDWRRLIWREIVTFKLANPG